MKLYSTNNPSVLVDFPQALFQSLPQDKGLYMPSEIPMLDPYLLAHLEDFEFEDLSYAVASTLLQGALPDKVLREIIEEAVNFPAPVREIADPLHVLELFHGPSLAFKDFGARFMSRVMAYYLRQQSRELHILVATSGDTGGAVALGFYQVPGIQVTILYPSGKVSPVQELQLSSLGQNIRALEVEGTFDDCQRLVKEAFLDEELNRRYFLSSANSINIARLIPQAFYYINAVAQLRRQGDDRPVVFSVPSGNFGNLTAGLIAQRMGVPIGHMVASTNINDVVPEYLEQGVFRPRASLQTLSNAMDVGDPSNFARMLDLFNSDARQMAAVVTGCRFTDEQTLSAIEDLYDETGYLMCPHTAVAYLGLGQYLDQFPARAVSGVFLATAHPCKFPEVYSEEIRQSISKPRQLKGLEGRSKQATPMSKHFADFKAWFVSHSVDRA